MAAIDVSPVVADIATNADVIVAVGMSVLMIYVGIKALGWVRMAVIGADRAHGDRGGSGTYNDPSWLDEWQQAAGITEPAGGVTYRAATFEEQQQWDRINAEADREEMQVWVNPHHDPDFSYSDRAKWDETDWEDYREEMAFRASMSPEARAEREANFTELGRRKGEV